jgi:hypothetical protein
VKTFKIKQKYSSQHSLLQEATLYLPVWLSGQMAKTLTTYHVQKTDTNKERSSHQKLW